MAPKWMHELIAAVSSCGEVIVKGNVRDVFRTLPDKNKQQGWADIENILADTLTRYGYHVLRFNRDSGFGPAGEADETAWFSKIAPVSGKAKLDGAVKAISAVFDKADEPAAIILDAKSMFVQPLSLNEDETEFLRKMDQITSALHFPPKSKKPHLIIWVFESDRDMPRVLLRSTPYRKEVTVTLPDLNERRMFIEEYLKSAVLTPEQKEELALKTGGMLLARVRQVFESCRKLEFSEIWNRLEREQTGAEYNPYEQLSKDKIKEAETFFNEKVIGQETAIKAVATRIRSVTMPFINCLKSGGKGPKAVYLFAGPTGVGKTETAKCIADLVFGSGERMYRIDLSEYKGAHNVARLIGSPPGYVGHDDGGQLTEKIIQNPFQLILLDEIDKPHESVHDILLSILDAGRLTDGKGRVADFSQSVIVLTSNLGAARAQEMWDEEPGIEYSKLDEAVREAIHGYYVNELNRPELYGRLLDSLVVFDFIREDAQVKLMKKKLDAAVKSIKLTNNIEITGIGEAEEYLMTRIGEYIVGGGRGIVKCVEKHFLEPVANLIYEKDIKNGSVMNITGCKASASKNTEVLIG